MTENNIDILIDVDNVSAKYVKSIFDELNALGLAGTCETSEKQTPMYIYPNYCINIQA